MKQKGFSLLELMMASSLGSLIILGSITIYLSINNNLNFQTALMDIPTNARSASFILRNVVRMAGFTDCEKNAKKKIIDGYHNKPPANLINKAILGNDILVIGKCEKYQSKIQLVTTYYFIGKTNYKDKSNQFVHALFRQRNDGQREELIPHVDRMEINYGIQTSHGVVYLNANEVEDWNEVISAEIALLFSSNRLVWKTPQAYHFLGKVMPPDRKLHRTWFVYASLR